ncbi:MAG: HAD hydrolase-like protein [bacterium]|nr:HAD hydrolase-like protein [bacterium]
MAHWADTTEVAYQAMRTIFEHFELEVPSRSTFLENITSGKLLEFYRERGIPPHITRKDLNVLWERHFNNPEHRGNIPLREGAREALLACRDGRAKVAIVSGSTHNIIQASISRFGIGDFIDHLEADAHGKIEELRRVFTRFFVQPEEMVYIDDTYEGLCAAKSIGAAAVGITGGFGMREHLLQANPDHLITNLHELIPLIGTNRAEQ